MSPDSPLTEDGQELITHAASICHAEPFTDELHEGEYTEPEWQTIDYLDEHEFDLIETRAATLVFSVPTEYQHNDDDSLLVQIARWEDSSPSTGIMEHTTSIESSDDEDAPVLVHGPDNMWVARSATTRLEDTAQ